MGEKHVILVCFESCKSKLGTVAAEDVGCSLRTLYINLHSHILALSLWCFVALVLLTTYECRQPLHSEHFKVVSSNISSGLATSLSESVTNS